MSGKKPSQTIVIDWKPDKQSKIPLYSQIVSYFSEKVASGDWVSGQIIPSQRNLSELFGVNRSTIVEAMDELSALGIIESGFGRGTRIANDSWSLLMRDKAPDWQDYIRGGSFHSNVPTVQIINRMEFEPGIIRMSTGELSPDLMQTEITSEVLKRLSTQNVFMNYPDQMGMPGLRSALQEHLRRIGIDVPLSCILIVSGALQALQLISTGIVLSGLHEYFPVGGRGAEGDPHGQQRDLLLDDPGAEDRAPALPALYHPHLSEPHRGRDAHVPAGGAVELLPERPHPHH